MTATLTSILTDLAATGLRMAQTVQDVTELEKRTAAAAARWLPAQEAEATSLATATEIGAGIDAAEAALATITPRVATLSQCFDRVARAVRRTTALACRIDQGWPRQALYDGGWAGTSQATLLRQVRRRTRNVIRANCDAESAERLFADLDARLDDPAFTKGLLSGPIEDIVHTLCEALGVIAKHHTDMPRRAGFSPPPQASPTPT